MLIMLGHSCETGIGQLIKGLRKHEHKDIQVNAKHTFGKWKESFTPAAGGSDKEKAGKPYDVKLSVLMEGLKFSPLLHS